MQTQTRSATIAKVFVATALIFFAATVGGFAAISGVTLVKKQMKLKPAPITFVCGAGLLTADYIVTPTPSTPFQFTLPSLALAEAQVTGDRDGDGTIKICLRGGASATSPNVYSESSIVNVDFAPWSVTNGTGNEPVRIFSDRQAEQTLWINPTRRLLVLSNSDVSSTRQVTISSIGFIRGVGVLDTVLWQAPDSRLSLYRDILSSHSQAAMFIGGSSNVSIEKSVIRNNNEGMRVYGSAHVALTQNEWTSNTTSGRGGAIWALEQAVVTDVASTFHTNEAIEGGAISLEQQASYTSTGSQFVGNKATGGSLTSGGGAVVVFDEGQLQCDQCVWQENSTVDSQGGAISLLSSLPHTFSQNIFERNSATQGGALMSTAGADLVFQGGQFVENVTTLGNGGAINMSSGSPFVVGIPSSLELQSTQFLRNHALLGAGGIYSLPNDSMIVDQGVFEGNIADQSAGALLAGGGVLTISNATFTQNEAVTGSGGAMGLSEYLMPMQATIISTQFSENHAKLSGGTLLVSDGVDLSLLSSQFIDSTAQDLGGAIRISGDAVQVVVDGASFVKNSTTSNLSEGGAIECDVNEGWNAELLVTGSTFEQNTSSLHGGAISSRGCALQMGSSTFANNDSADGGAAAVLNYFSGARSETDISISDSTFTNNQATVYHGGAIAIEDVGGDHLLDGNIFEGNSAKFLGGAIRAFASGPLTITNSTFTSNTSISDMGGAVNVDGAFESLTMDQIVARDNASRSNGGFLSARTYGTPAVMNLSHLDVRSNNTDPGYSGAGIYLEGGEAVVTNSLFAQNDVGGFWPQQSSAIKAHDTTLEMDYLTIAGNMNGITSVGLVGNALAATGNHLLFVNNDEAQLCCGMSALDYSVMSWVFPQTGFGSTVTSPWMQGEGNTVAPAVQFIGDALLNIDPRTSTSIETFNFHLQSGSPGVDIDPTEFDVDGSSADAGAYGGPQGNW